MGWLSAGTIAPTARLPFMMLDLISRPLLVGLLLALAFSPTHSAEPFDIVITGGRIVDGTGAPWYVADVGVRDGRIARIGRIDSADGKQTIDAQGLVVAPGFIDMMGQTATPMLEDPKTAINLLTQGITTINAGEGGSAAPLDSEEGARQGWTTMAEYFAMLELKGLPVNVVQTVGHTQVRRIVMGDVERRPSDDELAAMQALVREAMQAGAIGVSTALIYPPAVYAQTREIAALSSVAGEHGGRYFTHMRNEGDQLLEAIDEAIEIGREANTPVHIFHLKAAGQQNWGKMQLAIAKIKAARAAGEQITADIYPYINNGLGIAAMIHPRHFSDGYDRLRNRLSQPELRAEIRREMEETEGWENWFRHVGHDWNRVIVGQSEDPRYADLSGQSLLSIAKEKEEDPWDTFFNLAAKGAFVLPQSMSDANKILAMQQPFVSFCTDVGPAGGSRSASHPRAYGSFPRLLSRYVRDLGVISLERAVAQGSAAAANAVMAYDRGRIAAGLAADLIIFDMKTVTDRADFKSPDALSEGMQYVIVNGRTVLADGEFTGQRPGRVLRGPGYEDARAAHHVSAGRPVPPLRRFDEAFERFLRDHRIPGAAVAVTDQGRLVYARGFGYADLAARQQVEPESLFRIASISKPITAVAVLQLIEAGKLTLDDKVFEILDFEPVIEAAGDRCDIRIRDITIRHLLQHRGGWDRDESFDAMFQAVRFADQVGVPPPADQSTVIRAMFTQRLDFDPGKRYAYSNFGYCLLGRIIEKQTDQNYEHYVQEHVLKPLGITSMQIGATRRSQRCDGEVCYYHPDSGTSVFQSDLGQRSPSAYGAWNLEAMDSHGGWIASAIDLARFASAFDDPDHCPILTRESIDLMYDRPEGLAGHDSGGEPKAKYYSLGWSNRAVGDGKTNHWHGGSLPGTSTILIRRHDGRNFVALLNARVSPSDQSISGIVDKMLHQAANQVEHWPQEDLFDSAD
jgi:N-acyl-D-amino-acid deacylase